MAGSDKTLQLSCNLFGIKWPEQFTCLGIYLGQNQILNDIKQIDWKVDNIENVLSKLEKGDLSLFGRILITKPLRSKLIL